MELPGNKEAHMELPSRIRFYCEDHSITFEEGDNGQFIFTPPKRGFTVPGKVVIRIEDFSPADVIAALRLR